MELINNTSMFFLLRKNKHKRRMKRENLPLTTEIEDLDPIELC